MTAFSFNEVCQQFLAKNLAKISACFYENSYYFFKILPETSYFRKPLATVIMEIVPGAPLICIVYTTGFFMHPEPEFVNV